jgi:hypothetical protein
MSPGSVPPDPIPADHPQIQFLAFAEVEEVVGEPPGFDGVQLNRRLNLSSGVGEMSEAGFEAWPGD